MIALGAHTAAFADFHGHTAADIITRRKVFVVRRITLHEPLAFGVGQIAAFAACALGDKASRAIYSSGMKLHKFHILKRQTGACHHPAAITGAGMRGSGAEVGPPVTARGKNNHFRIEQMHGAIIKLPAQDPLTDAIIGHYEIKGEIFDIEFCVVLQRLAVKRVQDCMAGAVGGGASTLHRRAFAKLSGVAAKGTLVYFAFLCTRKRHAVVFQLINRLGRFAGQIFHCIGIAQPVRAFDRVIHMPLPMVRAHVG